MIGVFFYTMMDKTRLTFEEFQSLARENKTIPVYQRILADLLTPVAAWVHLMGQTENAFILESIKKGTEYTRYSYLGLNAQKTLECRGGKTVVTYQDEVTKDDRPFLEILREIQGEYNVAKIPGIPAFTGGLVGYLTYETAGWIEDIPVHTESPLDIPDALFMLFEEIIAFDHLKGTALVMCNVTLHGENDNLKALFDSAHERIDAIGELLHSDIEYSTPVRVPRSEFSSNFHREAFEAAVESAQRYIREGDIFQVVLSQRFQRNTTVKPVTLYRALRNINPSPYMFHLKMGGFDIIGASPELLVKVDERTVEVRPIAGTRPRGKTDDEDRKFAQDLLNDEKEIAEHLMLLDLGRNDVGKVCQYGTVTVTENMAVENYSHVMHIVSNVRGELLLDKDGIDALMSGFPAGTVTGAPKIRAMEIINELEPDRRGVYSGAVGFLDFSGNVNTCIAIRTMVIKDGTVHFQSGAGIVLDSDPAQEYEETVNKAKASMAAIDFAEQGLVA